MWNLQIPLFFLKFIKSNHFEIYNYWFLKFTNTVFFEIYKWELYNNTVKLLKFTITFFFEIYKFTRVKFTKMSSAPVNDKSRHCSCKVKIRVTYFGRLVLGCKTKNETNCMALYECESANVLSFLNHNRT